jgi:hypothetical protein
LAAPELTGNVLGRVGTVAGSAFGNAAGGISKGMFGDSIIYVWIFFGFIIFVTMVGLFLKLKNNSSPQPPPQYPPQYPHSARCA